MTEKPKLFPSQFSLYKIALKCNSFSDVILRSTVYIPWSFTAVRLPPRQLDGFPRVIHIGHCLILFTISLTTFQRGTCPRCSSKRINGPDTLLLALFDRQIRFVYYSDLETETQSLNPRLLSQILWMFATCLTSPSLRTKKMQFSLFTPPLQQKYSVLFFFAFVNFFN